jgi:hypothetical protein
LDSERIDRPDAAIRSRNRIRIDGGQLFFSPLTFRCCAATSRSSMKWIFECHSEWRDYLHTRHSPHDVTVYVAIKERPLRFSPRCTASRSDIDIVAYAPDDTPHSTAKPVSVYLPPAKWKIHKIAGSQIEHSQSGELFGSYSCFFPAA